MAIIPVKSFPPTCNNDRAWKAFEFFIPELGREVDMASDLMKAMFGRTEQVTGEVTGEVGHLVAVMKGEMKRLEIQAALGLKHEDHFREKYLKLMRIEGFMQATWGWLTLLLKTMHGQFLCGAFVNTCALIFYER